MNRIFEKIVRNNRVLYVMSRFHKDDDSPNESTLKQEERMIEAISQRLKQPTAILYIDTPECTKIMNTLRVHSQKSIKWDGYLKTVDEKLNRYFDPTAPSFAACKETVRSINMMSDVYSTRVLSEIDAQIDRIPEEVTIYFVIVENPLCAVAIGRDLAMQLGKRTSLNDLERQEFKGGELIRVTKQDAIAMSAPRVSA